MIEFLATWAKSLGVTIVVVSILEMLLPNNKTKKYIRMVLGVYVLFNIISPLVQNKDIFNIENLNIEKYETVEASTVNQTSMDKRIKELYEEEMKKDIAKKLKEKGYEATKCKVEAKLNDETEESKIEKIQINLKKIENTNTEENTSNIENKIITQVQKIKKVDTNIGENKTQENTKKDKAITNTDIQNVKKFLIEEYGVNEKCLEIN